MSQKKYVRAPDLRIFVLATPMSVAETRRPKPRLIISKSQKYILNKYDKL